MPIYKIDIDETLRRTVFAEADSAEEADKLIETLYRNGDIYLNYEDSMDYTMTPAQPFDTGKLSYTPIIYTEKAWK